MLATGACTRRGTCWCPRWRRA